MSDAKTEHSSTCIGGERGPCNCGAVPSDELSREECLKLLKTLGEKYCLEGLVLDMSNGWVLRDFDYSWIASGLDRVTKELYTRALGRRR